MRIKILVLMGFLLFLVACGSDSKQASPELDPIPNVDTVTTYSMFRDVDPSVNKIAGTILLESPSAGRVDSVWVYWADDQGNRVGDAWLKTGLESPLQVSIPLETTIPSNTQSMVLAWQSDTEQALQDIHIRFHDFVGNAALSGPGGHYEESWTYGVDRPHIPVSRIDNVCTFDNGLVSVIDMAHEMDESWTANSGSGLPNQVDDSAFPAYSFQCDESPVNRHREIYGYVGDELDDEIWTYSTINDSMYYGTLVYDAFLKYLGEPPLNEKIRIRVHFGSVSNQSAYWDGEYANFGDAFPFYYSMMTLDAVAHEVGHGVLNRISNLNAFEYEISTDARTLHEAFGDISGLMAKYEFTGHTDNWIHGEQFYGFARHLNKIETEYGAIASLFDYDDAGRNVYLRIGMITYPFYLLANNWGLETAYKVYVAAARECWVATTTLTEAALCIKQQAGIAGLSEDDVIEAFKTVKIKLFDEGVLSHFTFTVDGFNASFSDGSESTSQTTSWLWDFGDGQSSVLQNPVHTYNQSGEYSVRLTVTDQSNKHDYFERIVSIAD